MSHLSILKAVVFDLDGTLIDSAPDVTHAVNLMLAEQGRSPLPMEKVRPMIGDGVRVLIEKVLAATGLPVGDETMLANCATRYRYFYAHHPVAHTVVYDGVREGLAALRTEGYRLGLCTNKPYDITRLVLDALGMMPYFMSVVGGESTPFRKPDPRPLLAVMEQMGVERTACAYVGDSEVDVVTARNAMVPLVLVTYGYARVPVVDLEAAAKVESFRDLPAVLRGLPMPAGPDVRNA
ncbi:MAG: phosphoglycolate phosphatase [Rhodospirillaceae bacterium]|nr:MAG: phosphoglycolate phosphatase [Rhodospirillaceae bacterium]